MNRKSKGAFPLEKSESEIEIATKDTSSLSETIHTDFVSEWAWRPFLK